MIPKKLRSEKEAMATARAAFGPRGETEQSRVYQGIEGSLGKAVDLRPPLLFIISGFPPIFRDPKHMDPLQLLRLLDRYGAPSPGGLFWFLGGTLLNLRLGIGTRLTTVKRTGAENKKAFG